MSKVKITQAQADILVRENSNEKHNTVKRFVEIYGEHGRSFHLDELIRALYIGYEVAPAYKVGDWVAVNYADQIKVEKVLNVYDHSGILEFDRDTINVYITEDIRHATPEEIAKEKERRWWAKHDRAVWELKSYDVIKFGLKSYMVEKVNENGWHTFYEHGECYLKEHLIRGEAKVICFAEDRKDVQA